MSQEELAEATVQEVMDEFGKVDILVNGAEVELNGQWFHCRTEASPAVVGIQKAQGYVLPSRVEPLPSLE